MKETIKRFNYIRIIFNILYLVLTFLVLRYYGKIFGENLLELELKEFLILYISFLVLFITYMLIYFISIMGHELFHLLFGLKAKMKFVSFSVLNIKITKENDKLKIKYSHQIQGAKGYCSMVVDDSVVYNKKDITKFFMGGIIFNILLSIISVIIIIITENLYIDIIFVLSLIWNIYIAAYNAVPGATKGGVSSDMLHLLYYYKDSNYLKTISNVQLIQHQLDNGVELKDIDSKLFEMPKQFDSKGDILNALLFIDYTLSKEDYKTSIGLIKKVMKEAKYLLIEQEITILKLELIGAIMHDSCDINEMKDLWDDNVKKFLQVMWKFEPIFIAYNYMYCSLIEENNEMKEYWLNQLEAAKKKKFKKEDIENAEDLIKDINSKIKKSN